MSLSLLLPHHAEPLFAMVEASRERLRPWLPWVDRTESPANIREFIQDSLHRFAEGTTMAVGIWYQGRIVGGSGLKIDKINYRAEIGYWIASGYEGLGLITRTARALTTYGFKELGLHRIEIRCSPENVRSCAVPERLGFVREGMFREAFLCGGQYQDMYVYSRLASEHPGA